MNLEEICGILFEYNDFEYDSYIQEFIIQYAYHSNAIEGNIMTKEDVENLLKNNGVLKNTNLISIFEIFNHAKVFKEVFENASNKIPLSEEMVKNYHQTLMENIISGGFYRDQRVIIKGAKKTPPYGMTMHNEIKYFFETLPEKEKELDSFTLAAYTHAEFVKIHPFVDGNGRIARFLMNYQLVKNNYLPININYSQKEEYFKCLEAYANEKNLKPLTNLIIECENQEVINYKKYINKGKKKKKEK